MKQLCAEIRRHLTEGIIPFWQQLLDTERADM